MDKAAACCFTGHRPDKLPWGTDESDPRCMALKERLAAVLELRKRRPGVTLECARPCESQAQSWPPEEQERYQSILAQCDYETLVQHHYDRFCMMRRNRYMVDHAAHILTVYNGVPQGGTAQTLLYAIRKGLRIHPVPLEEET